MFERLIELISRKYKPKNDVSKLEMLVFEVLRAVLEKKYGQKLYFLRMRTWTKRDGNAALIAFQGMFVSSATRHRPDEGEESPLYPMVEARVFLSRFTTDHAWMISGFVYKADYWEERTLGVWVKVEDELKDSEMRRLVFDLTTHVRSELTLEIPN